MTEPVAATAAPAQNNASFWEDLIDIFYQPSTVFARRQKASAWPPFLFVVIAMSVITIATFNALEPAIAADVQRALTKTAAHNPNLTQETIDKAVDLQTKFGRYFAPAGLALSVFIVGLFTWILGKLFGAKEDFNGAMLITSYAYMPRVLGTIIAAAMALLTDPSKLTSMSMVSVGPARFYDPETTSPFLMALMQRLDLMVIWETILLAIGIAVLGKVPRGKAIGFAVLIWIVGSFYLLRNAYLIS